MSDIIIAEYKGYTIKFGGLNAQFVGKGELPTGWFDTYKGVTDKIDRLLKAESKGKFPIAVYKVAGGMTKGKITSINTEAKSAWFVDERENRQKLASYSEIYAVNENNEVIYGKVGELRQTILKCEAEQKQLLKTLTGKICIGK